MDNLFETFTTISKAGAYDIICKQRDELVEENKKLREVLKDGLATLERWSEHDPKSWDERDELTLTNIKTVLKNT